MSTLGKILGGVGYALDTPGALARAGIANMADFMRGEDRFQGYRATGREMLDSMGVGGGYAGGLAADFLVDPLNLLAGAGAVKAVGKLAKGAKATGAGAKVAGAGTKSLSAALTPSKSTAMAIGAPTAGFGVMAMNEDQDPALSALGAALMVSPLAVGMAKGIGRAAKGKKAVKGVEAKGATPIRNPTDEQKFFLDVIDDVVSDPDAHWDASRIFISDVLASSGMPPEAAKAKLREMRRQGLVQFSQVDLVESGTPAQRQKMAAGRVEYKGGEYNLIRVNTPKGAGKEVFGSLAPWLAAGAGGGGTALTHALTPELEEGYY